MSEPKKKLTPMQGDLMEFPTFWPADGEAENHLTMERVVMREGRPVVVRIVLSSDIPLPKVHSRQYIDVLVKKFVDIGKPSTNLVPVKIVDILQARGVSRSGRNYKAFYQAVLEYKSMNITFFDAWKAQSKEKTGKKYLPKVSGKSIIDEYELEQPGARSEAERSKDEMPVGWVRFTPWYANSLRENMRLVDQQILAELSVGYSYRVYEFVTKSMGPRPVWEIGLLKLGQAIPFTRVLEVARQVESLKRVFKQLVREGAFESIKIRGRGANSIATFIAKAPASGAGIIEKAGDPGEKEEGAGSGFPDLEPLDVFLARTLSELRQMITHEARSEGRATSEKFMEDLLKTDAIWNASIEKWKPQRNDIVEALAETKSASREGRIKTTVRQFFLHTLEVYCGHKNF